MVRFVSIQLFFWTLSSPRSKTEGRERACIILLAMYCLTRAVQFKFWECESRSLIKAQTTHNHRHTITDTHTDNTYLCYGFYSSLVGPTLCILTNLLQDDGDDDAIAIRIQMIFALNFTSYAQHTMRLSVLFAFIHFYSFCAGARYVLFKFRLQFVSIVFVSFCIFLSAITWPESVSVPCVSPSVYAEATMPTETYCQPAGGIVLCLTELARLLFLSFFPPSSVFISGVGAAARGLPQDSQTKVVTAEIAIQQQQNPQLPQQSLRALSSWLCLVGLL